MSGIVREKTDRHKFRLLIYCYYCSFFISIYLFLPLLRGCQIINFKLLLNIFGKREKK